MGELPLDPRSLANYILFVRRHFGFETTNLELQKLAFFSYAKFLVSFECKLCEGYFEAWEHGPVHPLLYREFKEFGSGPITSDAQTTNLVTGEKRTAKLPESHLIKTHIAETILQLRHLTAWQLRAKSHANGGPWHSVRTSAKINLASQTIIPDDVIREGYNRQILAVDQFDAEPLEKRFEDIPPEHNRSDEHFGVAIGKEKNTSSED